MIRLAVAISLAIFASGCASTDKVLQSTPNETIRSAKPPADVAFCLANKNNTSPMERSDGSRVILVKSGIGAVGMAFTVRPDGAGSIIEIRKPVAVSIGKHRECY